MSCSHCYQKDHVKPRCPNLGRSHEDCVNDRRRESNAFYSAANVMAELLGKYPPEERIDLAMEAFRRSAFHFQNPIMRALTAREATAQTLLKAEMAKWTPHHEAIHQKALEDKKRREERRQQRPQRKPTRLLLLPNATGDDPVTTVRR